MFRRIFRRLRRPVFFVESTPEQRARLRAALLARYEVA